MDHLSEAAWPERGSSHTGLYADDMMGLERGKASKEENDGRKCELTEEKTRIASGRDEKRRRSRNEKGNELLDS